MLELLIDSFAFFLSFKYWELINDPAVWWTEFEIREFEERVKGRPTERSAAPASENECLVVGCGDPVVMAALVKRLQQSTF
jgi:hypothetical protein